MHLSFLLEESEESSEGENESGRGRERGRDGGSHRCSSLWRRLRALALVRPLAAAAAAAAPGSLPPSLSGGDGLPSALPP